MFDGLFDFDGDGRLDALEGLIKEESEYEDFRRFERELTDSKDDTDILFDASDEE